MRPSVPLVALWMLAMLASVATAASPKPAAPKIDTSRGDQMLADYFRAETAKLKDACLAEIHSLDDWKARRGELRQQLFEMLGLDPMPERTDLHATVTGRVERDGIVVEKLYFQSRPHLYVTANLYLPKELKEPVPAILYVCGHGAVKIDGVSYGNKVSYQHHGAWFARHGYACLIVDSLQLGEIEGIHHGTYRYGMWWWNNRGYTPAGVEAWNCIRAIDYLQSRKEIDPERIGVTGRSGGGAYSWWISSIDERIKAAVPVAGITDLQNHVVDGTVEGHCDCMFMVNTYRWDYPMIPALVAPRALMVSNSDRDRIFPLDGVVRTYFQARRIYELFGAGDDLALSIGPGPHKDTQELQVPAFRWFNKHLKKDTTTLIDEAATKRFEPKELKVFQELPKDQLNSTIHETFVPAAAPPTVPQSKAQWAAMREGWRKALLEKSFRGWPGAPEPLDVDEAFSVANDGVRLRAYDFTSQGPVRLRLYLFSADGPAKAEQVTLNALDQKSWSGVLAALRPGFEEALKSEVLPATDAVAWAALRDGIKGKHWAVAFFAPRGVGPTAFDPSEKKQTQIRRRFMLLGQTLEGMQVWDVRRALEALRTLDVAQGASIRMASDGVMAGVVLYASLFEPAVAGLDLNNLPATHRDGPIFLNVSRYLEMPQAAAMAAERTRVKLSQAEASGWAYPQAVAKRLGWGEEQFQVVALPGR